MVRPTNGLLVLLLVSASLAGCRGYVVDRLKPRSEFVAPQLARYGIVGEPAQCVEAKLTRELSIWELRQFRDLANGLSAGGANPTQLQPWDLVYVAGLVKDAEVAPKVRASFSACNVPVAPPPPAPIAVAPSSAAPPSADSAQAPSPAAPAVALSEGAPLWVNLGAAASGQGIAVDARSVTREAGQRQAWFRLLRITGDQIVGETGYLLRVNCETKQITAHAGRTYGPGGALVQQKDYDKPEGPLAIEPGTVMEVAFHALCDEAN